MVVEDEVVVPHEVTHMLKSTRMGHKSDAEISMSL